VRCSQVLVRIVAWLDGELSAADSEAMQQHVDACPPCGDHRGLMERTRPNAEGTAPPVLSQEDWAPMHDAVMEAADAQDLADRRRAAGLWVAPMPRDRVVAMAYAAALLLALGWGWVNQQEAQKARLARDSALQELLRYQQVVAEQQPLRPLPTLPQVRPAAYVPFRDTF
jgi:anti-sigma factor RsiW